MDIKNRIMCQLIETHTLYYLITIKQYYIMEFVSLPKSVLKSLSIVFSILLLSILMSSCGTMQVYVNQDSTYSRKNPITITNSSDVTGTLGELQFQLQSNGYKLMSLSAAKKALNYDSQQGENNYHSEITNTTTFNSVYVLEMHYSYFWDSFYYAIINFSATITDLSSGEIIMTANFKGQKGVNGVVSDLVREMNKVIK